MQTQDNNNVVKQETEVSFKELVLSLGEWWRYFLSKRYVILTFAVVGALLGLGYAFLKKPIYSATTSFVLESEGSQNGLAAYAGLASSIGIDLGASGGGLFEGDNILELYKSRNMISRTLLSEADFNGKTQLLIDRYIEFNKLREKWKKRPELKNIRFNESNKYPNQRLQLLHDSIMSQTVKGIEKDHLLVERIDKKMTIIEVKVTNKDELFAKNFNQVLVENVNRFYLDTKTKKSVENIAILQKKVDSVQGIMTGAIYRAASVADATPNQNPTRLAQREAPIRNAVANAEINQEVLGTLLQNLELGKISFLKETPLIQIVDEPVLPLEDERPGKLIALIIGGFNGILFILIILGIKRKLRLAFNS